MIQETSYLDKSTLVDELAHRLEVGSSPGDVGFWEGWVEEMTFPLWLKLNVSSKILKTASNFEKEGGGGAIQGLHIRK